jgi:gluconate kinase
LVVLIMGASHTGKTLLAQKMMERYQYPYLSEDLLKMGLIRSGYTKLTPEDDEDLVDYLWPVVREIIKTAVENGQNLIIEGCYFPFNWMQDFTPAYLDNIRCRCLVMSEKYIRANFDAIKKHADMIEKRGTHDNCTMESVLEDNAAVLASVKKYKLPYTLITDTYDVSTEL